MGSIRRSNNRRNLYPPVIFRNRPVGVPKLDCVHFVDIPKDIDDEKRDSIKDLRIAVIAHVFYGDLWEEIESYLKNIPIPFDLYITMIEGRECQEAKDATYADRVFVLPNKGFDVGPFIHAIKEIDLSKYDLVCKIHTKKSTTHGNPVQGAQYRSQLLVAVLDDANWVTNILYYFLNNNIGLAGSRHRALPLIDLQGSLGANHKWVETIFKKFNIVVPYRDVYFIGGTMFWIRSDILQTIKDGPLDFSMFESPEKQKDTYVDGTFSQYTKLAIDGQLAHAVERLFGAVTMNMGYEVVGI